MTILSEKKSLKSYFKKTSEYVKSLLSSQHVEINSGQTLQATIDEINNKLKYYVGTKIIIQHLCY